MLISKEAVAPISDEPETSFLSAEDEMVVHAPILGGGLRTVTFKTDTMKVWRLISAIKRDLYCWTYVKLVQSTRCGSKTFCVLWDHLLGPDNVDNSTNEADRLLAPMHYSGESKCLNL